MAILFNCRRQRGNSTVGCRDRSADDVRSKFVVLKFLQISIGESKHARLTKPSTDSTQFGDFRKVARLSQWRFYKDLVNLSPLGDIQGLQ